MRDSPLVTEELEAEIFIASADNRLAAISNDVRVRVDGSKKKLIMVLPRRVGTFLMERVETSLKVSAVSRSVSISSTVSSRMPKRSLRLNANVVRGQESGIRGQENLLTTDNRPILFSFHHDDLFFFVVFFEHDLDYLVIGRL